MKNAPPIGGFLLFSDYITRTIMTLRFLTKAASGVTQLVSAIVSSAGAGDANKIIATDANGKIDITFIPSTIGQVATTATASENLTAGDFIYFDAADSVAKADNTDITTAAQGFVLDTVTATNSVTVYFSGVNTAITATDGASYFLGTSGSSTTTAPTFAVGSICQLLGYGSPDGIVFEFNEAVEFANQ